MPRRSTTLSPRKEPRQRRSADTRERILDAAARVFAERGYAGTTNHIAAEASLSVGSLYQYFPNKDSILVELIDRHVEDATRRFLDAQTRVDAAATLEERVRVLVQVQVESHRDSPRLHQVLFEEAPRPAPTLARLHAIEEAAVAYVRARVLDDPRCAVRDQDLAARLVVVTVESLVHRLVASPRVEDLDVDAFVDEATALVAGYLTAGA